MKPQKGFTLIELIVVIIFVSLALVFFFLQKANIDAMNRDDERKTAINAMYYALENYYYEEYGYYPETISEDILPVIDPELFTDPLGYYFTSSASSYSYSAADCDEGKCAEYTLRATLEKESDYIKKNKH